MINDQRYSIDKPLSEKHIKTKKSFSKEVASGSIHSYFQLARMIVTKVREIETQELNECSVGTVEGKSPITEGKGFANLPE